MKIYRNTILLFALLQSFFNVLSAQTPTQTVRGMVIDKVSQAPLPGAVVLLLNTQPAVGVSTDAEGKFRLEQVPVGKQSLRVSFIGYKELVMPALSVNAGKELVLTVSLEEDVKAMDEVVVSAKVEKNKPLNDMSTVSTRAFSVEETQKFAAAVNDPGRMATSFAGVVGGNDGSNLISIRGNSPNGLVWRMEGVEIPNPNHFAGVGTSGGGIAIISAQLLGNSDFSTGAFAAEYGNALSGIFDLRLRKGNNQKREYTFQLGVLGVDAATEGPFKKGYDGSYLVNYRYSTLNLLGKIGVPIGDANTLFQDLSFNVSLPTRKLGTFTVFGFGGLSSQTTVAAKDSAKWKEDGFTRLNTGFYSNTGAVGITNTKLFANQSYLKTALVCSGMQNGYTEDKLMSDLSAFSREAEQQFTQDKITLSSVYTKKISARSNIRTGIILNQLGYNLSQKDRTDTTLLVTRIRVEGSTQTAQAFFQWNYKLGSKLTTNVGLHYLQLFLNGSRAFEPRASLRYDVNPRNNFTLGYGLHSQIQPLGTYFAQVPANDGTTDQPNKHLALSKAHHLVLGYDWNINAYSHLKTEVYYQHLFHIPISQDTSSTFSVLNAVNGFATEALNNRGLGRNYGIELTYERFMYRNFYYLVCGSLYDSKYRAANGTWYNTYFNTNYAFTVTAGKEWLLTGKGKNRVIGVNIKSVYTGGLRYTPIDLNSSQQRGTAVYDNRLTFDLKNPDYYRLDIRVSLKRNYKHVTGTLALDIQNTTNRRNVGGQYFDLNSGAVKYWYQTPLIPVLSYRLEF